MSAKVTNATVQRDGVTVTSAQFVVAGGLSFDERVDALSALVERAADALDLPATGPIAAELLYRIADDRAGAAPIERPAAGATAAAEAAKPARRTWRSRIPMIAFWAGFVALTAAAWVLQHPPH